MAASKDTLARLDEITRIQQITTKFLEAKVKNTGYQKKLQEDLDRFFQILNDELGEGECVKLIKSALKKFDSSDSAKIDFFKNIEIVMNYLDKKQTLSVPRSSHGRVTTAGDSDVDAKHAIRRLFFTTSPSFWEKKEFEQASSESHKILSKFNKYINSDAKDPNFSGSRSDYAPDGNYMH